MAVRMLQVLIVHTSDCNPRINLIAHQFWERLPPAIISSRVKGAEWKHQLKCWKLRFLIMEMKSVGQIFFFSILWFFFFFFEVILRNALQRLSLMHVFLSNEGNEWLVLWSLINLSFYKLPVSIIRGNGELYEVGRSFLNAQLIGQDKKTELKWKKKITALECYSTAICWQVIII